MMPKLSVYVQDELWDQARAADPELNPSQLVQAALRRYTAQVPTRPSFARERPADSRTQVAWVQQQLTQRARQRYEEAYHHGLALASELPWEAIDQLAAVDWDLQKWVDQSCERRLVYTPGGELMGQDSAEPFYAAIAEAITAEYTHESTYRLGVADALQDVWSGVTGEADARSDAPAAGSNMTRPDDLPWNDATDPDDLPFD